ncbi:NCS2 family permease [Tetragenococcus halophilus]|uniref:Transporter n=1 Tax=Tetragenococcus halophilus (strain DSM 20338 / JCM 20259 / NCIMB 9735 / NBRC 12172) TaxID=945021 RepID=A0AAN1SGR3_TETHN|nr:NCS2 family permease [Tetragenococcus halophilus]MCO8292687.1 NCS2 family permease [Tetragenococcus halophilus]QXN86273.1 NCS2 family permease [Tetragenococcus halophilus]RQD29217.1 NCS2 family permease [Tetragenococcus halophilus subsp. halophilus DSM 20339]BAK94221.1 putative transporter [Tetragenococcus halophilus NBRC 12172]GBD59086.1 putative transporter [Tetragenococcus halophilus subsp. halophilus]
MEKFFKLKENGTNVSTELMAGVTTFFAMSYILFVNPTILSAAGMPFQAVFLATIVAAIIGTLVMGLFANVPYAQAPGMGLNAFFTYTVVFGLGYSWQQALAMVFICGLINIFITVTKIRKLIIRAIPETMQHAIGGGIGIFVAYSGLKNANLLTFSADSDSIIDATVENGEIMSADINGGIVPALSNFDNAPMLLALIGLVLMTILVVANVRAAVLIGIVSTTIIGIFMGVVDLSTIDWQANSLTQSINELGTTFGAAFGQEGMQSLFNDSAKIPQVIMTIIAFSLSDTFDTIGTFIGTGRRTGIFSKEDEDALEDSKGMNTKMDRALFADAVATSIGSVFGTSNTTTFVESAAGIGAGGRTGLTSVTVAVMFGLSSLFSPLIALVPAQATAPALVLVGIMMLSSFKDIDWTRLEDAVPAFFASIFMGLCYSISYGIAAGFIFYTIVKIIKGKTQEVSPILWVIDLLFILNFIILALL